MRPINRGAPQHAPNCSSDGPHSALATLLVSSTKPPTARLDGLRGSSLAWAAVASLARFVERPLHRAPGLEHHLAPPNSPCHPHGPILTNSKQGPHIRASQVLVFEANFSLASPRRLPAGPIKASRTPSCSLLPAASETQTTRPCLELKAAQPARPSSTPTTTPLFSHPKEQEIALDPA